MGTFIRMRKAKRRFMPVRLILASGSPRRRQLLEKLGLEIEVRPVSLDESRRPGESPDQLVARLARQKAQTAAQSELREAVVLAADTIVVDGDEVLGKPADEQAAHEMLLRLRGKNHQVLTAVALLDTKKGEVVESVCTTVVPMRNYSDSEIEAYIRTGSPLDKAGAYGIQDRGFSPVDLERLNGCFANVMGLPLCHVADGLCRLGWPLSVEQVATWCLQATGYDCPEYPERMRDISCLEK